MSTIRSIAELNNSNNDHSALVKMNNEKYYQPFSRFELDELIEKGLDDIQSGRTRPFSEAMADLRAKRKR